MKRLWIIILLVIQYMPSFAQGSYAGRINFINKTISYYQFKDPSKALNYAQQGLELAKANKNTTDAWHFYQTLGNLHKTKDRYPQALYYYDTELQFAQQQKNTGEIVMAYRDLGLLSQSESKFTDAQNSFFKALSVCESDKSHPHISLIYVDIASVYDEEDQIPKVKEYTAKALKAMDKKDTLALAKAYELLGVINYETGHAVIARDYHQKALRLYQLNNDSIGQATMYMQIASSYDGSYANAQKCLAYCFKSKALWDKTNPGSLYALYNLDNLSNSYWNMVQALDTMQHISDKKALQQSLLIKAESSFKDAYRLSVKYSNIIAALFALKTLAEIESYEGKNDLAYKSMVRYNHVHDSLYSQQNVSKIAALEGQHEIDLRDKQLQINKLEIGNKRRETIFLITGIIFLLLIALLIYIQSRNRKRNNDKLTDLNGQLYNANKINTQFFSILHHDIRRPISNVINLLWLIQKSPETIGDNKEELTKKATDSAEHLLETMDDLLLWSKGQMENFKPQLKDVAVIRLFNEVKNSFEESNVAIHFKQDSGIVLRTDEHYIKTIMLNLTNNALHALSKTPSPAIEWAAWQDKVNFYLSISDNGPGATEVKFKALYDDTAPMGIKNGLGLHIVRDLAKAINCKIAVNTKMDKGVEIQLKLAKI